MLAAAALPLIGATLGGIQGYQQSGGDLGTALLGSGIGAAGGYYLPGGVRMAGQALMNVPGISSLVGKVSPEQLANIYKGSQALKMGGASVIRPEAQAALGSAFAKKAATAGATALGLSALPGIAGGAANIAAAPVRALTGGAGQVAQTGAGAALTNQRYASQFGANLPPGVPVGMDQYGNIVPAGLPQDVLGLPGIGRTLESQREGRAIAENMQRYGDINLAYREAAARKDFERQAAMKGIGQNIATNAAMIQNAQIGAQNLGQTFGQGITNTLGTIYQYQ